MKISRKVSGKDCIKTLCNNFNFKIIRQKGNHVILKHSSLHLGTVVPLHSKLKIGTLKGILKLAKIDYEEFIIKL